MSADLSSNELAALSDAAIVAIWLAASDPEHLTPREQAALAIMEARGIDF